MAPLFVALLLSGFPTHSVSQWSPEFCDWAFGYPVGEEGEGKHISHHRSSISEYLFPFSAGFQASQDRYFVRAPS